MGAGVRHKLQKLYPEQPDEENVRLIIVGIMPKHPDHHHETLPQEPWHEPLYDFQEDRVESLEDAPLRTQITLVQVYRDVYTGEMNTMLTIDFYSLIY